MVSIIQPKINLTSGDTYPEDVSFPPLLCNTSIIGNEHTGESVIIDPGGDVELIMDRCNSLNIQVRALILTHAHADHVLACGPLKSVTGAVIYLCKKDLFLWENMESQCKKFNLPYITLPEPDEWLTDGMPLPYCGGIAIHTPGHSPGSMCFLFEDENVILTGDTLYCGGVGRTDLKGGDPVSLRRSIMQKLAILNPDTNVIPGHGPNTTIRNELRSPQPL